MAKTANINLRIEPSTKAQAEALFNSFGISVTDAINIFLNTSIMEGGFPFQIKQPRYNRDTELAIEEARQIMAGKLEAQSFNNVSELFASLDED
ncbi:TPA: type II toxin-antitoxin system RelB/DinJ family antitoxin [Streptococcus suis]|uniref:type II toxin-antitoxin system RelB/DinJ family antitoxin n=1 Tax=Streptococcus TaxID=1301 RepID=UPI00155472C0|nr:type II toxin-antitoxin system RelB/DinJ family antitoxin [Streptococcus suis]QGJ85539.1 antitoxin [Streptococcus phage phi-SsuFJNP8_rum]MCK3942781.1 type II toxin-antitoxin system RelB/DinJ family antitoxin [Streptococcus suis]NQJ70666.1 type II toxin-antitoxin system RelB/DinJ family antitoxin [Streptococcus suis]NQR29157.1 type II toxin-antitoxin system RelB/DinJ family antitoxin [Streptococcus suis]